MDNLFAYLGNLGSRDVLLKRNRILEDFVADMNHGTVSDPGQAASGAQDEALPKNTNEPASCLQLAEDVKTLLNKRFTCTLSLTSGAGNDTKAAALVALEDYVTKLYLAHHNEQEKADLIYQIGLSAQGELERSEIGQLRDRLWEILKDPVSDYAPEQRTAPAQLKAMIAEHPAELFAARPGYRSEVIPFIEAYYSAEHRRRELAAISVIYKTCLGAPAAFLPDFLARQQALLDSFAHTAQEMVDGRAKLEAFATAARSGTERFPSEGEVAIYKEQRYLSQLQEDFNTSVQAVFEDELTFLMISSYEYTRSLYRLKIRNSNKSAQALYISAYDKGDRHIKKLLEYSSQKYAKSGQEEFMNSFCLGSTVLNNQKTSKIVLPHFIRRIYDTGVWEEQTSERETVAQSIYDIGPVIGLISVSTTRRNPYLLPLGDAGMEGPASVTAFLTAFSCVPLDESSAQGVLAACKKEAEHEKFPKVKQASLEFLASITPHELAVFGQYMTERLTHACFLSKAYQLRNSTPYRNYMKRLEDSLHKRSLSALQTGLQDYFDFYLDPVIEALMLLPLPLTRLRILDFLEDFIQRTATDLQPGAAWDLTPAELFRFLDILTGKLRELVTFWTETVIPCHLLYYHYLASEIPVTDAEPLTGTREYYAQVYERYLFFANNDDRIDIDPAFSATQDLQPLQEITDGRAFDLYAGSFYNYFLEETYRIALSRTFYQQYVRLHMHKTKVDVMDLPNQKTS